MSAPVTAANSARSGGPLQRMPFGKYKGLPFAQVPEEYAAWLLKRDIDERLRAALKGSGFGGEGGPVHNGSAVAQPVQAGDISRVVSEFLQARGEAADAKRRVEEVRGRLIPLLDRNNGHWTDRASNQRVAIEEQSRWEYDASALHRLVDSGLLAEEQFAECLRTVVDKNVVASWIELRAVSAEQLNTLDARTVTRVLRMIRVRPLNGSGPS
jgi:hypothetical protein